MNSIKKLFREYVLCEDDVQFKTDNGTTVTIKQDSNGYYWDDGQNKDPAHWDDPVKAQKSYFNQLKLNNTMSENKLSDQLLNKFYELDQFIKDNNINLDVPYNQMRADPKIDSLASQVDMDSIDFLDQYLSYKGK